MASKRSAVRSRLSPPGLFLFKSGVFHKLFGVFRTVPKPLSKFGQTWPQFDHNYIVSIESTLLHCHKGRLHWIFQQRIFWWIPEHADNAESYRYLHSQRCFESSGCPRPRPASEKHKYVGSYAVSAPERRELLKSLFWIDLWSAKGCKGHPFWSFPRCRCTALLSVRSRTLAGSEEPECLDNCLWTLAYQSLPFPWFDWLPVWFAIAISLKKFLLYIAKKLCVWLTFLTKYDIVIVEKS